MKLTPKQQRFVAEYLKDMNGAAAYVRAGYASKNANVSASQLLANPSVAVEVEKRIAARSQRTEITVDRVLKEFATIAFVAVDSADGIYKAADKLRALEALGKHLGMFPNRVQMGGDPKGEPIKTQNGWSPDAIDTMKREILGIGKDGE